MPPLESFMGISSIYCREHFFNSLEKRDLVVGVVSSVLESGIVVTLLCMDGGKVRDIDELKTTAFCPLKELPRLFANQSPIEGFQVKDKVRGVVLNVNQETEKVIVSMLDRSLPEEHSHIKLGLINEDDFPVHYRRKLHIRGLAFDELLHSILGFNNSGNVSSLLGLLHLSDSTSIMRGLHRKTIPEKEYAESLRKYQSQKWAHQSVANGVAMFKAGKQVEAMQYLNKALQIDVNNVEALVARGALYANNESYNLAIQDFEQALDINSEHQNARKYLYETLLALAKVLEDQSDFDGAEKQYHKAMSLQPNSVEIRELIRYMMVRKDRKERERALRGRSPSPVINPERGFDKFSDRNQNKETSRTLKKLIQEDRSKHGDSSKRKRSSGGHYFEEKSHSRHQRSVSSSSSSSNSSSSGSSSDNSSSSDSEDSSAPGDHRQPRREKDRRRTEQMNKDADKYMNPESSKEDYQAEMDRRSAAKMKIESPSGVFNVNHTSSFLFGADGNYRTSPPHEEKKKAEEKARVKDRKDEGTREKHKGHSSKYKSKLQPRDKDELHSKRKRPEEKESGRSGKDHRSSRSSERAKSNSEQKRKRRESYDDTSDRERKHDSSFERKYDQVSDRDSTFDNSFERKLDQFSESGSDRGKVKSDRQEKYLYERKKSPEMESEISYSKDSTDNKDREKYGAKEHSKKHNDEDELLAGSRIKDKKLPSRKRDRSRSGSAHSFEERERSMSPEEHKRQYLQMKYERWKQATQIELERKCKQAQYKRKHDKKTPGRNTGKGEEGRDALNKDKIQSSYKEGQGSSRGQGSSVAVLKQEAVKSKWDSPGDDVSEMDKERKRKSRFDTIQHDKNDELDKDDFVKTVVIEGKRNDIKETSKNDDWEQSSESSDAKKKAKLKTMTDTEKAQASRDMEGLRIHIKNDHFNDKKLSVDDNKGHSGKESREGSITSSRGTHSSSRHHRSSPELDRSKRHSAQGDTRDDHGHSKRSPESEGSYGSCDKDYDEIPDKSSGRYRNMEKNYKKSRTSSDSQDQRYFKGSDYKLKSNISDKSGGREYKKTNKYESRGAGRGWVIRGRGGNRGQGRGKYKGSFKDKREYVHKKHYKDYHKGHKQSRNRSPSDSRSSRSSSTYSSSSSPSSNRRKGSRSSPSRKSSSSYRRKSWTSNRSPHSYVDPYDKSKPKFTSARFPKVKQPILGELAMSSRSESRAPPQPAPLTEHEELKKKEVLSQLESFLSQLKEKKKEQTSTNDGTSKTPEKV
ncbi:tetratricopeptide repeat protein 14-like isoform X2 [Ylistrum balloti]|nr:tetratricopeptide repeat protein 14-like isoform X2 [Ylistrum balloti]